MGQGEIFVLECDIFPKEMRTEEYSTYDMVYVWIPIEDEALAYNLFISVPLGEKEDEYINIVKKMLDIKTSGRELAYDVSEDKRGMLLAEKLHINYDRVTLKICTAVYEDGTTSEKADCFLDDKGNIMAWFFDPIERNDLKAARAGNVTIEMNS